MDKSTLIDEINSYIDQIAFANDCYNVCQSLSDASVNENEKVNLSPGFFQIAWHALTQTLMITVARLYAGSYGNDKTLISLINLCRDFLKSEDSLIYSEAINDILAQAQSAIEPIRHNKISMLKARRDKIYAHNDKVYFGNPQKAVQEFPIMDEDIEELLRIATELCVQLLDILDNRIVVPFSQNCRDLNELLIHIDLH